MNDLHQPAFLAALLLCAAPLAAQQKPPAPPAGPVLIDNDVMIVDGEIVMISQQLGPIYALKLESEDASVVFRLWMQKDAAGVLQRAAELIKSNPADHRGYALRYLTELRLGKDRKAAHKTAALATGALLKKPGELVGFVNRALFVDATAAEYRLARMGLDPLMPDHRKTAEVRVAHLKALLGAGKVREAQLTNKTIVEDLRGDKAGLIELARAICETENGSALGAVAQQAFDLVEKSQALTTDLLKLKYRLLHDVLDQKAEARKVGERIIASVAAGMSLNNFVWYLLVDTPDAGKYPSLALMGARRMLKAERVDVNEWDTIALAFFHNGLVDEAIGYQQKALAMEGTTPAYHERMAMYKKAKAAREQAAGAAGKDAGK